MGGEQRTLQSSFLRLRAVADSFDDPEKRTNEIIQAAKTLGTLAERLLREKLMDPGTREWAKTLLGMDTTLEALPHGWLSNADDSFLIWAQWPSADSFLVCVGRTRGNSIRQLDILELDQDRFETYCQFWNATRDAAPLVSRRQLDGILQGVASCDEVETSMSIMRYVFLGELPTVIPNRGDLEELGIEFLIPRLRLELLVKPGRAENLLRLGKALVHADRYQEGFEKMLAASREPALRADALWHAAHAALGFGETRKARSLLKAVLNQPNVPQAYVEFAQGYIEEFDLVHGTEKAEKTKRRRSPQTTPPPTTPSELFG